jgi:hypothetical protein
MADDLAVLGFGFLGVTMRVGGSMTICAAGSDFRRRGRRAWRMFDLGIARMLG